MNSRLYYLIRSLRRHFLYNNFSSFLLGRHYQLTGFSLDLWRVFSSLLHPGIHGLHISGRGRRHRSNLTNIGCRARRRRGSGRGSYTMHCSLNLMMWTSPDPHAILLDLRVNGLTIMFPVEQGSSGSHRDGSLRAWAIGAVVAFSLPWELLQRRVTGLKSGTVLKKIK